MRTAAGQATRHVRPAGSECEDAALEEAPAPLSQAPASAARLLQACSTRRSPPMPSVQHVHVNAEHDAMTNDKAAERRSKLVGKIWLLHTCSALLRCKCVGASCSYPTAANGSSWRMNGFAM